jgi:hypothetical protein
MIRKTVISTYGTSSSKNEMVETETLRGAMARWEHSITDAGRRKIGITAARAAPSVPMNKKENHDATESSTDGKLVTRATPTLIVPRKIKRGASSLDERFRQGALDTKVVGSAMTAHRRHLTRKRRRLRFAAVIGAVTDRVLIVTGTEGASWSKSPSGWIPRTGMNPVESIHKKTLSAGKRR